MEEGITQILSNPSNWNAFLLFVLIVIIVLIASGREYKILGHIIIPSRSKNNYAKLKHSFQKTMAKDLEISYEKKINAISNLNYEESLNWENDFLQRVRALYEDANVVYAVTLSKISDFWVSESDRLLIKKYLDCQFDKEIHRLFVFENPYDLKKYENILMENHKAYGSKGGVYITSTKNYQENILFELCDEDSVYNILDKDFGIWQSDISILATLQGTKLSFKQVDIDHLESFDAKQFINLFSSYNAKGMHKWDASSRAVDLAPAVFSEDVTYVGPVTHLVFMKHEDRNIIEEIASTIVKLDEIREAALKSRVFLNFKQAEPWWGINIQSLENKKPFSDGKYLGQLKCDDEYLYVLIIQLPSIAALREWYVFDEHSDIREMVYTKLVDTVEKLYEQIKTCGDLQLSSKFEDIENSVFKTGKIKRMDYIFNKRIEDIVPFKINANE